MVDGGYRLWKWWKIVVRRWNANPLFASLPNPFLILLLIISTSPKNTRSTDDYHHHKQFPSTVMDKAFLDRNVWRTNCRFASEIFPIQAFSERLLCVVILYRSIPGWIRCHFVAYQEEHRLWRRICERSNYSTLYLSQNAFSIFDDCYRKTAKWYFHAFCKTI